MDAHTINWRAIAGRLAASIIRDVRVPATPEQAKAIAVYDEARRMEEAA